MNEQWIKEIFDSYKQEEYVTPRLIGTNYSFNKEGISLYYYIDGYDSQGFVAGLKMDFFGKVRFTNYKKPHSQAKYEPYFDQFTSPSYSCSYDEMSSWTLGKKRQKLAINLV